MKDVILSECIGRHGKETEIAAACDLAAKLARLDHLMLAAQRHLLDWFGR